MAIFRKNITGNFEEFLSYIDDKIMNGSVSASREETARLDRDGVKIAVHVYERYSYIGQNRLSLTLTIVGSKNDLDVCLITSGGSQAILFKINTWGEESFLGKVVDYIEDYK